MKPPYFFMLSARSTGLKTIARVEVGEEDDEAHVEHGVGRMPGAERIGTDCIQL